jgi:hypothetical protein
MTGLFCEACLTLELREYFVAIAQSNEPLGSDESTAGFLCRQIAFTVVPLMLAERESRLLIEEIEADWLETMVN